jgi:hypothetical protein
MYSQNEGGGGNGGGDGGGGEGGGGEGGGGEGGGGEGRWWWWRRAQVEAKEVAATVEAKVEATPEAMAAVARAAAGTWWGRQSRCHQMQSGIFRYSSRAAAVTSDCAAIAALMGVVLWMECDRWMAAVHKGNAHRFSIVVVATAIVQNAALWG